LIIFYNEIQLNMKIFFNQNNHVKSRLKHVINIKSQINIIFKDKIEKKKKMMKEENNKKQKRNHFLK